MVEKVGAIVYTVDMDTAAVTKGADRVNAVLDSVASGAGRLDGAMGKAGATLNSTAKATDEEAAALRKLLGQIDPTVAATQRLDSMTKQLGQAFDKGQISAKDYANYLAKLDSLYAKLESDAAGYTRRVQDQAEAFRQATAQNARFNAEQNRGASASGGFAAALTPLAVAVASVITLNTLSTWGKMAEQFTLLQIRIRRLSPDVDTAASSYQQLLEIATGTGMSLPATVKLWETLTTTLKTLGATKGQVLALTDTLQKIGKLGGSSADETSRALRQLGQSLSAGTLRAQEYNSIVEQTPELIRQLAAGAGMSMGQFRQAMLAGKITAQDLLDLLLKSIPGVNAEFAKLPRSASDAGNAVSVAFGAALSVIDQATGASKALAATLDALARGVRQTFNPSDTEVFNRLLADRVTLMGSLAAEKDSWFPNANRVKAIGDEITQVTAKIKAMQDAKVAAQKKESDDENTPKPTADTSAADGKALKELQERLAVAKLSGEAQARLTAEQKLSATATEAEKKAAGDLGVEIYNLTTAKKEDKKATNEAESAAKSNTQTIRKLNGEVTKGEESARAASQTAAELSLNKYATPEQIANVRELAGQIYDLKQKNEGLKADAEVFKNLGLEIANVNTESREAAQLAAQRKLSDFATPEEVATVRAMAAALYDMNTKARVDPLVSNNKEYDQKIKDLDALATADVSYADRANQLKLAARIEHETQIRALQEETFKQANTGNALLLNSIDALSQSGTSALSGLLSGTSSLKDALGGVANTVLNSVIGAFVTAGTEWVKQEIIKQGAVAATTAAQTAGIATVGAVQVGTTATIAATTTTAAATTGAAVAGSMAPAAGLASIASFGSAAVIGGAALLGTMLLAKSFGGGRQYGGPVDSSKMYRVNEGGAPEIFNAAGGKQYMMPNSRGEVVSNKDATSGGSAGGAVTVNVNNSNGSNVRVNQRQLDRQQIIDVFVEDISTGGKTRKMVNQVTGTNSRGS